MTMIVNKNEIHIKLDCKITEAEYNKLSSIINKYKVNMPNNKKFDGIQYSKLLSDILNWSSKREIKDFEFILSIVGREFVENI